MMDVYYEDLSPYHFASNDILEGVFHVGWLDKYNAYSHGVVNDSVISYFCQLICNDFPNFNICTNRTIDNITACPFCDHEIHVFSESANDEFLSITELWIPSGSITYAAPALVYHYITDHNYLPPQCFLDAVMSLTTELEDYSADEDRIARTKK